MNKNIEKSDLQILDLISVGFTNLQIAETLGFSERTIERNVNKLYKKFEAKNKHELAFKYGKMYVVLHIAPRH